MTRRQARWHPALIADRAWLPPLRSTHPKVIEAADQNLRASAQAFPVNRGLFQIAGTSALEYAECSLWMIEERPLSRGRSGLEKIVTTPAKTRTTESRIKGRAVQEQHAIPRN